MVNVNIQTDRSYKHCVPWAPKILFLITHCSVGVIPDPSEAGVAGFSGVIGPAECWNILELDGGGITEPALVEAALGTWLLGVGGI